MNNILKITLTLSLACAFWSSSALAATCKTVFYPEHSYSTFHCKSVQNLEVDGGLKTFLLSARGVMGDFDGKKGFKFNVEVRNFTGLSRLKGSMEIACLGQDLSKESCGSYTGAFKSEENLDFGWSFKAGPSSNGPVINEFQMELWEK